MIFPTQKSSPELYPYRHGIYFAFFNALNWQVAIGMPTVLFMQELGANAFQVGLVFAWTFLLTPAQVLSTALLSRYGYKRLTMAGWGARSVCLLVPVALAVLAPEEPVAWMVNAMIVATFFYCLIRALGTSVLTTWFYQLVPAEIRGRYWATDQLTAGVAIGGSLICYAALFILLPPYPAFIILYLVAIGGAVAAYRQLKHLPDVERPKPIGIDRVAEETPRLILRPSLFRTYLWISVALFASITPISPFGAYYLKTTARLGTAPVLLLTMLTYVGLILANLVMRAHMDRIGAKLFFKLCFLTHAAIAIGWVVFLEGEGGQQWMLPVLYVLQGFGSGCWNSANLAYLAKIVPEHERALPVSIHGAVITFVGGCTPVLWGLFMKVPGDAPAVNVFVLELFFGSLAVVCLGLLLVLRKLPEKSGPIDLLFQGSWMWRPFRAVANLVNLVENDSSRKPRG
jgi:MFS family permease